MKYILANYEERYGESEHDNLVWFEGKTEKDAIKQAESYLKNFWEDGKYNKKNKELVCYDRIVRLKHWYIFDSLPDLSKRLLEIHRG